MQYKKFGDFAKEEKALEGSKIRIDDVINKEILVTGFKLRDSKYNKEDKSKCLTLQFEMDGSNWIVFTGSNVLIDLVERYKKEIPFLTTIKKINRYYTFT